MKCWSIEHIFSHPWHVVVGAAFKKYPNPENEDILGIDIIKQRLKNDVLYSERIIQSNFHIPMWASKLGGFSGHQYSLESTQVDPKNRTMTLVTRNVDERLTYYSSDSEQTRLKQETTISVNLPFLKDFCERSFLSIYTHYAQRGPEGLKWVIQHEFNDQLFFLLMFFRAVPPSDQKPYLPPPGRFAIFSAIYNDNYYWSLSKSVIGFAVGIFVARHLSEEFSSADVTF
ncbi:PRELI/MSF1 domain-containing protein [Meloidogyne graminicola]|uniref:PRELI/MSF1 domain-containing protein n=1 Tax=Meloidogyne graminicola TaxID=189291 RepID=A0A8T0A0R5_9BILA|nr:PRELI/MSF1 domain-containing protein [Meloidogyne graminicola]